VTDWLDDLENEAWRGYIRMQVQLNAQLARLLQSESDLSHADFEVLVTLSEAPGDQMRVFELAEHLRWERSRLSHHLTRMERRELVVRAGCPSDGRGAFVELTAQGRRTIEEAAPGHLEAVRRYFIDNLDRHELRLLADISRRVVEGLPQHSA
jgi:DNA-binding MarR family transcriptional regulator